MRIWLKQPHEELHFEETRPITLICDNQIALHIALNTIFHETKNVEIDCHFVKHHEQLLIKIVLGNQKVRNGSPVKQCRANKSGISIAHSLIRYEKTID